MVWSLWCSFDALSIFNSFALHCSNTSDYLASGKTIHNGLHLNDIIQVFAICRYITYVPTVNDTLKIELCEIEVGGCFYGKYGDNCEFSCPENCDGFCDLLNGNCLLGCSDGWIGFKCDEACSPGYFGNECLQACPQNCLSPLCENVMGKCIDGCKRGWQGFNCTRECGIGKFGLGCLGYCNGCIANKCNHFDGVCTNTSGCKPGFEYGRYCNKTCRDCQYGINCNRTCNCLTKSCNKVIGTCDDTRCKRGWHGDACDEECGYGYFGFNCVELCEGCFNMTCDIFEGNCVYGCSNGFIGDRCHIQAVTTVAKDSTELVMAVSTGSFLFGLVLTVLFFMRRQIISKNSRENNTTERVDLPEQRFDQLSMEHVTAYQDLAEPSIPNIYDHIDRTYINTTI